MVKRRRGFGWTPKKNRSGKSQKQQNINSSKLKLPEDLGKSDVVEHDPPFSFVKLKNINICEKCIERHLPHMK